MNSKLKKVFLFIIVLCTGYIVGVFVGRSQIDCRTCPPEDFDFSLFWEVYGILEERSAYFDQVDQEEIIHGAISGMLKAVNDPHISFFDPEEAKDFREELSGFYQGVGMEIGRRNEELVVITPFKGSPAERSGLRAGDRIYKIDGEESLDFYPDKAANLIRGEEGTTVTLTIKREGWEETRDFEIRREEIQIPSLTWEEKEDNIVYIHIYQFYQPLRSDFNKAALEILETNTEKIVLDLRNNPGGYLGVAVDIAGWFIEKGEVVSIESYKDEEKEHKSPGNAQFSGYPIVVLINQGSASGSEILAGALRYHNNAVLVGETSFGKGSIQEAVRIRRDSLLKLTTAKWLTPDRVNISEEGLTPDEKVEITEEDFQKERDPQLEKAIQILKNK